MLAVIHEQVTKFFALSIILITCFYLICRGPVHLVVAPCVVANVSLLPCQDMLVYGAVTYLVSKFSLPKAFQQFTWVTYNLSTLIFLTITCSLR